MQNEGIDFNISLPFPQDWKIESVSKKIILTSCDWPAFINDIFWILEFLEFQCKLCHINSNKMLSKSILFSVQPHSIVVPMVIFHLTAKKG